MPFWVGHPLPPRQYSGPAPSLSSVPAHREPVSETSKTVYNITPLWSPDLGLCLLILCWGFPCSSIGKESACNAGEWGSIPGLGRSLGEGKGYPLQYSGLENPMDYSVHGIARIGHDWVTFTFTWNCPGTSGYVIYLADWGSRFTWIVLV